VLVAGVVVEVEPDPVTVELDRPVEVADREDDAYRKSGSRKTQIGRR
jgi:hypothetical protein